VIIDPATQSFRENYKLLIGSIVPRPIAFVSTLAPDGTANLAPFSFFTAISSDPPSICFSPGHRFSDNARKDTFTNIEATGEFVVNVVTERILEQVNATSIEAPPEVDEFRESGLTPAPSLVVKPPRVLESPIGFECRLHQIISVGPDRAGGAYLVIGIVVMFHVDEAVYDGGRIDVEKLRPVGRLAGIEFTTLGKRIALPRPVWPTAGPVGRSRVASDGAAPAARHGSSDRSGDG
jgi:flavin reductase (DIM6/NTAB) family NADH-FMN oxidoreductase RutF